MDALLRYAAGGCCRSLVTWAYAPLQGLYGILQDHTLYR